jgi:iron complex transport system permease protein
MNTAADSAHPKEHVKRRENLVRATTFVVLLALAALIAAGSLFTGKVDPTDERLASLFHNLRLARTVVGFLVGAALAVGGVVVQGLFRNPLADPSVLGTTAGASVGGQLALVTFQWFLAGHLPAWVHSEMVIPIGCLLGGFISLLLLLSVARVSDDLLVLLLTGFLLSSLFLSMSAFLTNLAQDSWELGRAVVAFTLGDLGGSGKRQMLLSLPLVVIGIGFSWFWGSSLDLMLSGEDEARSLGVAVERVRLWSIVWTAVLTGAAVASAGSVGFVGLVVPHALRPFVGVRHRWLVPASALGGGLYVIACDLICRHAPGQAELPLGVITGLVGAPVFLFLLMRSRRGGAYG